MLVVVVWLIACRKARKAQETATLRPSIIVDRPAGKEGAKQEGEEDVFVVCCFEAEENEMRCRVLSSSEQLPKSDLDI